MFTPLYGYFGAASTAGKILKLNEAQMVNNYGIAYAQCAGNVQVNIDDEHALTKRLSCGFAARAALCLQFWLKKGPDRRPAQSGKDAFGLFNIYQRGDYSHDVLVNNIGKYYEIDTISFKPYASCRQAHSYIDAALQLKSKYNIKTDDIDTISVFINELAGRALCEPAELRCNPKRRSARSVSAFLTMWAWLLPTAKLPLIAIQDENLGKPEVLAITKKIVAVIDPVLANQKLLAPEKAIEIRMKDGTVLTSSGTTCPKGDPQNPMSWMS